MSIIYNLFISLLLLSIYRNGPTDSKEPYGLSPHYWHVFAARLAFVVVFEVRFHHFFYKKINLYNFLARSICNHWNYAVCNPRRSS